MDFDAIEQKWQKIWDEQNVFAGVDFDKKPKYYALIEFPYPSGTGCHVGHVKAFSSLEVMSRMKRLQGYNVMFPIGWDAFGLPAENFAIKHNIPPRVSTNENIKNIKKQLKRLGFSFDWSREIDTTDENYFKWTQWIFCQLFKKGLVYKAKDFVNYCPNCDVVLANEDCQGGVCDRCSTPVEQREKEVWFLKIRDYAERLLAGVDNLDFPERVKEETRHWIGKSEGAEINFDVEVAGNVCDKLKVYTTRCDTLFGVTFMVVAPEHPMLEKYKDKIKNIKDVQAYQLEAKRKSEFDRVQLSKEKTGVKLDGIEAINPVTKKHVPIFVADYVMMGYGTGAIMAVPAHDTRDFEFAKKFGIEIVPVVDGGNVDKAPFTEISAGKMINSDFLNGLDVEQAKKKMLEHLSASHIGQAKINYQLKDWAFNRQRYWGEPFPIVYCPNCGVVLDENLPIRLPEVKEFKPNKNGESPLAQVEEWVNCSCPKCGAKAKRETDTMPQWAGSSWYFLRYMDPHNNKEFASKENMAYWGPADIYNGGMEHVTRHLIYSRFWNMALFDMGLVPFEEPYKKRTIIGLVLGEDGNKMSKSLGNVVDPMQIVQKFGADVLRLYILFMGEYENTSPWSSDNIVGCKRFLDRIERMTDFVDGFDGVHPEHVADLNLIIQKVSSDIDAMKFNTAISALMVFVNKIYQHKFVSREEFLTFLKLLYPFAPHFAEEMNERLGAKNFICKSQWPKLFEDNSKKFVKLPVQINGKMKELIVVEEGCSKEQVLSEIKKNEKLAGLTSAGIKKVVFVPNKIINLIV